MAAGANLGPPMSVRPLLMSCSRFLGTGTVQYADCSSFTGKLCNTPGPAAAPVLRSLQCSHPALSTPAGATERPCTSHGPARTSAAAPSRGYGPPPPRSAPAGSRRGRAKTPAPAAWGLPVDASTAQSVALSTRSLARVKKALSKCMDPSPSRWPECKSIQRRRR